MPKSQQEGRELLQRKEFCSSSFRIPAAFREEERGKNALSLAKSAEISGGYCQWE
jgi:hypothetical protein